MTIKDLQEILKFKLNSKIEDPSHKIMTKDRVVLFNDNVSMAGDSILRDLYVNRREDDGWLYLDFLIESHEYEKK